MTSEPIQQGSREPRKSGLAGMLPVIVVALAVGVGLTLWMSVGADTASQAKKSERAKPAAIDRELDRTYGAKWRSLGVTHWEYGAVSSTTFYFKAAKWKKIPKKRKEIIARSLWSDMREFADKKRDKRKSLFVMFHDEKRRMYAAYEPKKGLIVY